MEFNLGEGLSLDMIGTMTEEEIKPAEEQGKEVTENLEDLFAINEDKTEDSEGVGDGDQEIKEDTEVQSDEQGSPNFYASIADSLKADGILTLDDEYFKDINSPEDFATLIEKQAELKLEEKQRRIDEALNVGLEPEAIKQYENIIGYLDEVKEDAIKAETKEAEQLRQELIYQDYVNRGFSQERALKEVKKSIDSGTDIEDAIDALKENKDYFNSLYTNELNIAKQTKEQRLKSEREQSLKIEDKFKTVSEPIPGVKLTEKEKREVLNQYTKFIDKDESGKPLNAIQKYAKDNPVDYQYNINLLFYLTKGFKDFNPVVNKQVKTKTKSSLSELEFKLKGANTMIGGGVLDISNNTDKDSYSGLQVKFD